MKLTVPIRTHEVRVGDLVEVPDGTYGEVTQILNVGTSTVLKLVYGGTGSFHILADDAKLDAVLEDDGPDDVEIYGAGSR